MSGNGSVLANVLLSACAVQVKAVDQNASIIYRRSDIFDLSDKPAGCVTRTTEVAMARKAKPSQTTQGVGKDLSKGAECLLKVIVDHTFFQEIADSNPNKSVSLVTQHIAVADFVFRTTDVDMDSLPNNIGFSIVDIQIYESADAEDYKMKDTSLKHSRLMNEYSSYNFDAFCLAVAFTYREFGQLLHCLLSSYSGDNACCNL